MRPSLLFVLMPCAALFGCAHDARSSQSTARSDAPFVQGTGVIKGLLSVPEIVAMLEASEVGYRVESFGGPGPLTQEQLQQNADTLWSRNAQSFDVPVRRGPDDGVGTIEPFEPSSRGAEAAVAEGTKAYTRSISQRERSEALRLCAVAEDAYRRALEQEPEHYLATVQLGDTLHCRGEVEEALELYRKGRTLNPVDHRSYLFEGRALLQRGDLEEGLDALAWALALRPRRPVVRIVAAVHLARAGHQLQRDLLLPHTVAARDDDGFISIKTSPTAVHWMPYGFCKAMWLGEPEHREAVNGTPEHHFSTAEELECLAALIDGYEALRARKRIDADPVVERLQTIVFDGHASGLVLYELASRVSPHIVQSLPAEQRQAVKDYVREYVIVREGEVDVPVLQLPEGLKL